MPDNSNFSLRGYGKIKLSVELVYGALQGLKLKSPMLILTAVTHRNMSLYVGDSIPDARGQEEKALQTIQPFFIWSEGTVIGSQNCADRWGTPRSAGLLTGRRFRRAGLKTSLAFAGMSRVKQKKTLNCLLFFSAVTRKGFGERQMSPLWTNAKPFKTCWCFRQRMWRRRPPLRNVKASFEIKVFIKGNLRVDVKACLPCS